MDIHEFRVRYALKTSNGRRVVHGIICDLYSVKKYTDRVKEVGYELVGIDDRIRDDSKPMFLSEGWREVKSFVPEEPKPEYGYLSFKERR